jgi:agmatine deiminase
VSADVQMRDIGPAFVKNGRGEIRGVHWVFNGWGGLTGRWDRDEQVGEKILRMEMMDRYKPAFILEGGSIHVDGEGTAITTEECLLHGERNKNMNKQQIEKYLMDFLGVEKVIWLPFGVVHDETRGHVDNMACFVRPAEIALCWTDDPSHPQYERSNAALKLLESETDAKGRPFRVHRVNLPPQLYITEEEAQGVETTHSNMIRKVGQPLAGSYINFYIWFVRTLHLCD